MKSYREIAIPKDPIKETLRTAKAAMKGRPQAKGLAQLEVRVVELEATIIAIIERLSV